MTFENNFSVGVDDHDIWNTRYTVLLTAIRFSSVIVNWCCPAFGFHMLYNSFCSLVDTNTNDFYLISPVGSSFFKHFLVMCHRSLTRWTPSSPEVNQPNFSLDVVESNRL